MKETMVSKNNVLFYTILKLLIKTNLSDGELANLQRTLNESREGNISSIENLKRDIVARTLVGRGGKKHQTLSSLLDMLTQENLSLWLTLTDVATDFIQIKNPIIFCSKMHALRERHIENAEDPLSVAYDDSCCATSYEERTAAAILCQQIVDNNLDGTIDTTYLGGMFDEKFIESFSSKCTYIEDIFHIYVNNIFMIILDESVSQSIRSTAGISYEACVNTILGRLSNKVSGHDHDSHIQSVEYDFKFEFQSKTIGVSAKRTLRERYKQNIEDTSHLDVDQIMIFTLGTDLNEDKLNAIVQKQVVVVVASEVYDSTPYLRNSGWVISSSNLTKQVLAKKLSTLRQL